MNWYEYGHLLPLRTLEEIRFWKEQEKEHTLVIRALVPDLEPPYVKLLEEWEVTFANSERVANQLLKQLLPATHPPAPTSFVVSINLWRQLVSNRGSSSNSCMFFWSKVLLCKLYRLPKYSFCILSANRSIFWAFWIRLANRASCVKRIRSHHFFWKMRCIRQSQEASIAKLQKLQLLQREI